MYEGAQREESVPMAVQLLRRACAALDRDADSARREIRRALELLLDSAVRIPPDRRVQGLATWQARVVVDHVLANLDTPMRVEDLAALTQLSKSHFSRAFKQSTGMPPHHYLITRRVSAAIALIRETDRPLSEISLDVGFADQSHFTRTFVQLTGETPGEFRHRSH